MHVVFCMFLLYCCLCGVINDDDDDDSMYDNVSINTGETEPINGSAGNFLPGVREPSSTDESPCYKTNLDLTAPAQCDVLTLGTGDTGQLGLGPHTLDTTTARRVRGLSDVVQVAAGGMHTVCLNVCGKASLKLNPLKGRGVNWLGLPSRSNLHFDF